MIPLDPLDERRRLQVLRDYGVLDTPPEREFDDIARLAARVCGTPMALVSLVDEHRQWFKARVGIEARETAREVAFCDHVIRDCHVMDVPDALLDARFADNPLVHGEPYIRAYVGAPLRVGDLQIGTLCAMDHEPRSTSPAQRAQLEALARLVVDQLELRKAGAALSRGLADVQTLEGLLPVCAGCGDVRDDEGPRDALGAKTWRPMERYLADFDETQLVHETCPDCAVLDLPGSLE